MSICSYLYASGLRLESGHAVVELDGKRYRVVRTGKGASRLDRPSADRQTDGEITLKDLEARLAAEGRSTITATVGTEEGWFQVPLDPANAMGHRGRRGDFAAALDAMPEDERDAAALYQLETLPYSTKAGRGIAQKRLDDALSRVPLSRAVSHLGPGFASVADDETFAKAVAAAGTTDILRFGARRMSTEWFAQAVLDYPADALEHALDLMNDGQLDRAVQEAPLAGLMFALDHLVERSFKTRPYRDYDDVDASGWESEVRDRYTAVADTLLTAMLAAADELESVNERARAREEAYEAVIEYARERIDDDLLERCSDPLSYVPRVVGVPVSDSVEAFRITRRAPTEPTASLEYDVPPRPADEQLASALASEPTASLEYDVPPRPADEQPD